MKKTAKYIQDFKDIFGEQETQGKYISFVEKIKNIQKTAFPSGEYKQNLLKKLQNSYLASESQNIPPRFSLYQLFGVLGSFCFISLTLFGVYMFYNDVSYIEQYKEDISLGETQNEKDFKGVMNNPTIGKISGDDKEEILHTKTMTRSMPRPNSADQSMEDKGSSSYSSENPQNNQEIQNSEVFPEEISNFLADQFLSDDMMMQVEDSEAIHDIKMQEFYKICEENEGKVLDDDYSCEFEGGEICSVDNITPESHNPCEYLYRNEKEE